jgi:hypothetical protein
MNSPHSLFQDDLRGPKEKHLMVASVGGVMWDESNNDAIILAEVITSDWGMT